MPRDAPLTGQVYLKARIPAGSNPHVPCRHSQKARCVMMLISCLLPHRRCHPLEPIAYPTSPGHSPCFVLERGHYTIESSKHVFAHRVLSD